jgi:cytosine/adenosine deaminase-related metal-dependent hydrolase
VNADLLVLGGAVVTVDALDRMIEDGGVAISNGRIAAIGARAEIEAAYQAPEILRADGHAVLPGLVDAYAHAGHGMIRAIFHPDSAWPTFPLYWHHTTPEWWRADARLQALERLLAGVTTGMSVIGATPARADHAVFSDVNAEAHLEAGLSLVLGVGPPDPVFPHLPEPFEGSFPVGDGWERRRFTYQDTIAVTRDVIKRWHGAGEGRVRVALAAPYLLGRHVEHRRMRHRLPDASDVPKMLAHAREMRALADELGVLIHTHMFRGSVAFAMRMFGAQETAWLLGPDVAIAHANGLDDEEIALLGERGCGIATVAYTHENLWYGLAPIAKLIAAGCPVAVTTDGAAPYTSLDLWREMARARWNQWLVTGDQRLLAPEQLLRSVTIDAARVLNVSERVGSLEPGKDADLILVDLSGPHIGPIADLAASLVGYATSADVRTVIAKGEVLLRDRIPLRVDRAAITAAARGEAAKALAQIDLAPYRRG